jgi:DNA-binding SARP family transcriptional activator
MFTAMWLGVLGPTVARDDGVDLAVQQQKHRALLAVLATSPGRPVPDDLVFEALWGDAPPASPVVSLNSCVSLTKRLLEPDLPPRAASRWLARTARGYVLQLDAADLDVTTFTRTVSEVHVALGPLAADPSPVSAEPSTAQALVCRLDDVLRLWRGTPFADVASDVLVAAERTRLGEFRALALEDRATLLVATGATAEAVGELEALVASFPLRERLWVLLATAQARLGRQADALGSLLRLRRRLDDELGLEPSAAVQELQLAILRQQVPAVPTAEGPVRERASGPEVVRSPGWPIAGRVREMDTLETALARADTGEVTFVRLVGEPGIGKSRLTEEFLARARARGADVLLGRSSPERDAPPLWPWTTALGHDLGVTGVDGDPDAARFAVAQGVLAELQARSAEQLVVCVLEDVHWADDYSLRVLRHVVAHGLAGRLVLLCTLRAAPESEGLVAVAEALARRHAVTVALEPLDPTEAAGLLSAVAGDLVDARAAVVAWQRTDGNPFYLVEYARLARDRDVALSDVLDTVPHGVADVTRRRLRQLPEQTQQAVSASAVIGRDVELDLVAQLLHVDELEALSRLEPAVAVGVLDDLGADRFRFSHALVRDAAYAEIGTSRRERLHAFLARTIESSPQAQLRAGQIARHWAAAGDLHVRPAWRAAARAGRLAMAEHAAEEAQEHVEAALSLLARDPRGDVRDRLELLVEKAHACRWSSRLDDMTAASDEAVLLAGQLGDPDLVVRAAARETSSLLWPRRPYGTVNPATTAVLHRTLAAAETTDSRTRCVLMMTLADELYYAQRADEVDALAEGATTMARRLGDPALLVLALQSGFTTRWRSSTAAERLALAQESVVTAREIDDRRAVVVGQLMAAVARCSLGDVAGVDASLDTVVVDARAQRMYLPELAAVSLRLSLASLRGDDAAVDRHVRRLRELDSLVSMAHSADAVPGALLGAAMWSDRPPVDLVTSGALARSRLPLDPVGVVILLRAGLSAEAADRWQAIPHPRDGGDHWHSEAHHSVLAEIALGLGDAELGSEVHRALLPLRGRCLMSGSAPVAGPADAFLALAAAAAGRTQVAAAHAQDALVQCAEWQLPVAADWLRGLRERHGF